MSPQSTQDFLPQVNLEVQITASLNPVSLAKDTQTCLKGKGWILNSEDSTSSKLLDILFSATLSFKLPSDASTAIWAVAFLLCAHADESITVNVADHIIDKMIDKMNDPLVKLDDSIDATKSFLDATTQKQPSELLTL